MSNITAGWYPDHEGIIRWWDGAAWGPPAPQAPHTPFSGVAIAGFVCSLVSLISGLWIGGLLLVFAGGALSMSGLIATKPGGKRGRVFAALGLTAAILGAVFALATIARLFMANMV